MSSRQVLRMKYHPAKKEVNFVRVCAGKEMPITGGCGSVLSKYVNKKGQFILQDHGNRFFEDILEAFDGEEVVHLEVIMTQKDYEDFRQMLDYFNNASEVKISASLIAEMPDMDATYELVKKHGLDSIEILEKNRASFYDVNSNNENVRKCIDNYAKEINEATKKISDKIETLEKNTVNVCFSGTFSSGKSMLINSLIGYAILPTNIKPETAAMFIINSPKDGEKIRINFEIMDTENSFSEIVWDDKEETFRFVAGPSESPTRKSIQEIMNSCKNKEQFEQMHDILKALNENQHIWRVIKVYFPIAIDNEQVRFTIYDTPGTDSVVAAHKQILKDALSEQTHSILVFVTYPNGLSGSGDRALLEYLNEIENKEDKTVIDLDRSLFVINFADMLTKDEEFEQIRTGEILKEKDAEEDLPQKNEGKEIKSIKLCDKKVFFTSAKYAYIAAAMKNGIASESDSRLLKFDASKILDSEFGQYYRHNRCASSEFKTKRLQDMCVSELKAAQNADDLTRKVWTASGLYALEMGIKEYGEKYASAVKTFSIIDEVDKALAHLNRNAQSIERQNSDNIRKVEEEITIIRDAISLGIANAKKNREIGKNESLPSEVLTELHLDADSIKNFVREPARKNVDTILRGFLERIFGVKGRVKWDSNKENVIEQVVQDVLNDYTDYFKKERKKLLEELRDGFIDDIRKSIIANGEMSEAAKNYILAIDTPEIEAFSDVSVFGKLYEQNKKMKKWLWWEESFLDKEKFISDMDNQLRTVAGELTDNYIRNYRDSLNNLLYKVESEFNLNMEKYSVSLRAKQEDKKAMEELRGKILTACSELHKCQEKLNLVIWEVNE